MLHTYRTRVRGRSRGFVLVTAALTMVMTLGVLGLALDLGRMYVARNELQAFVDAATIAAAFELNGSNGGLDHARDAVSSYRSLNRWNFNNTQPESVTTEFATTGAGPWDPAPASAVGVQFVRVRARASVSLYFMPGFSATAPPSTPAAMLLNIGRTHQLWAAAMAGQDLITSFRNNLLPYSPDAIDVAAADFGLTRGGMHTFRWPPPGQRAQTKNYCDADEAAAYMSNDPAQRGFIDIGDNGVSGSGGSAFIRQAIISNVQSRELEMGDILEGRPGNRGTESDALRERVSQDTDTTSQTYAQYLARMNDATFTGPRGNGRRFVVVPINNPLNNAVLGFGGFFLHGDICAPGGDSLLGSPGGGGGANVVTCCAEYVGPALVPGRRAGSGGGAGAYQVRLFQ